MADHGFTGKEARDEVILNRLAVFLFEDGKIEDALALLNSILDKNASNIQAFAQYRHHP